MINPNNLIITYCGEHAVIKLTPLHLTVLPSTENVSLSPNCLKTLRAFCLTCSWSSWVTAWTRWSSSWWAGPSWLWPRSTETTSSGTCMTLCQDTPPTTWPRPSGTRQQLEASACVFHYVLCQWRVNMQSLLWSFIYTVKVSLCDGISHYFQKQFNKQFSYNI